MTLGEPVGRSSLKEERGAIQNKLLRVARNAELFMRKHDNNLYYPDGFEGISVQELTKLGIDLLHSDGFIEAYGLLARYPETGGICFYDRLIGGPELLDMYKALDIGMHAHEPKRVARGLDIATGTGFGAKILSRRVEHVVAADISGPLVSVAQTELQELLGVGNPKYARTFEVVEMNALNLSVKPEDRFDIVTSIGLSNFLTKEEREQFYTGVKEVLKPGGRYYEPQMVDHPLFAYATSPRAVLAQHVAYISSDLNKERLEGRTTSGFPVWESIGFKKVSVIPEIPYVGVMKLVKTG